MKKIKEKLVTAVAIMNIVIMQMTVSVYAGALRNSKFVNGAINLLNDATTVALVIVGIAVGLKEAILFVKRLNAEENEKPTITKEMKTTVMIGILGETIVGLIKVILSYFK